ncbi:MAG: TRSP domain-containing protein, partial [Gracilibacteraceae bacterium]|nr:TRSP domain-containing protein [Gracilibacteraceae bacterium]
IAAFSLLRGGFREISAAENAGGAEEARLEDYRGLAGGDCASLDLSALRLPGGRAFLAGTDLAAQTASCREAAAVLERFLPPPRGRTLYIGTGELIYAPLVCAGYLGGGEFQSTTQSPVLPLPGSAIESGVCFDPPDAYSRAGYLYNVPRGRYAQAVIFTEKALTRERGLGQLAQYLRRQGMERVTVALL